MFRWVKSFGWAMNGLRTTWREELNFRIEAFIGAIAIIGGFVRDFAQWQWIFLVLIIGWVLMSEMVNTAIEDMCDKLEPNQDSAIGRIKDIMAGYVLVSSVCALIAGVILFLS